MPNPEGSVLQLEMTGSVVLFFLLSPAHALEFLEGALHLEPEGRAVAQAQDDESR